jgi:hypothetical protein
MSRSHIVEHYVPEGMQAQPAAIQYGEPRRPSKPIAPKTTACANSINIQT